MGRLRDSYSRISLSRETECERERERVLRSEFAVEEGCDYPCKQAAINYSANDGALNGPRALPCLPLGRRIVSKRKVR